MPYVNKRQLKFGLLTIVDSKLDPKSRNDLPKNVAGFVIFLHCKPTSFFQYNINVYLLIFTCSPS